MEPGGGGVDPEQISPRPEHLLQLRKEVERLRAGWVSGAVRARSVGRRAVTLGREPLEGCLRKLRQARRGWGALLDEAGDRPRGRLPPRKQEALLNLLDLGLALLDRIEGLRGRKTRRRGAAGGPEGRGSPEAPPKPPASPKSGPPAGGGGGADGEEASGAGVEWRRALGALRGRFGALQEGMMLPRRRDQLLLPPARELRALRLEGCEFALRKAIALDEAEGRLREALWGPLAREEDREEEEEEEPSGGRLSGDPPRGAPTATPAAPTGTWREEARALQEQLGALARAGAAEEKAHRWREAAGFASRESGPLDKAGRGDPRRVRPEEAEAARGPLLGDTVWGKRAALQEAIWDLPRRGVPTEASMVALQEKAGALVEATNGGTSPEEAAGSRRGETTTGAFLGAGGESRSELLARLGIPAEEMDALDRHLEGLWEALEDIYLSKEVDAPREKVEAVSRSVAAFKGALRAAGRAEGPAWERLGALERCVEALPLEEMAALNEELRTLTEVLREKAEAPEDEPWMEVGEAPDWGQAETWKAPGAGADPTPVVTGGRRDQDRIGASGLPFPASVGASSFSTKEDTGSSRPVNSPGGASASGPPSGLGARRNWHKEVTQEARQSLVPKFAEDITGRQRSLGEKPAVLVQVQPFRKRGRPRLRDGQASIRNHKLELARSEQGR